MVEISLIDCAIFEQTVRWITPSVEIVLHMLPSGSNVVYLQMHRMGRCPSG